MEGHEKPDGLIQVIECDVSAIHGSTSTTYSTDAIDGGPIHSTPGGDIHILNLQVKSNSPVERLSFRGNAPRIGPGSTIKAYIMPEEERVPSNEPQAHCYDDGWRTRYFPHELTSSEKAVKLELSPNEFYTSPDCPTSLKE